jgi:GntR family transcriptional repressor for pyruvate dehydrogenase complex
MEQLRPVRLYEQVALAIRSRIVGGELRTGERLPTERELAAGYGVSRNVVREAIRALAKDGLVQVRQGSGTYVADATSRALGDSFELALTVGGVDRHLIQLIEVRQIIEPSLAGIAAERATSANLDALRREVDIMEGALDDVETFIAADHRFHVGIAEATQNHLLPMILFPIVDVLNEHRKRLFSVPRSAAGAQVFHHRILDAIVQRDPSSAVALMEAHLGQVSIDTAHLFSPAKELEPAPA